MDRSSVPKVYSREQCNLFQYVQLREDILNLERAEGRILRTHDHGLELERLRNWEEESPLGV
jgi:hypothetical protein